MPPKTNKNTAAQVDPKAPRNLASQQIDKYAALYKKYINPAYKLDKKTKDKFLDSDMGIITAYNNINAIIKYMDDKLASLPSALKQKSYLIKPLLRVPDPSRVNSVISMKTVERNNNEIIQNLPDINDPKEEFNLLEDIIKTLNECALTFTPEKYDEKNNPEFIKEFYTLELFSQSTNILDRYQKLANQLDYLVDAEAVENIKSKSLMCNHLYEFYKSYLTFKSKGITTYLPGVKFDTQNQGDRFKEFVTLREKQAALPKGQSLSPEEKLLFDEYNEVISELYSLEDKRSYATKQATMLSALTPFMTSKGFGGQCYDMQGNPIDIETAYNSAMINGTEFLIMHTSETARSNAELEYVTKVSLPEKSNQFKFVNDNKSKFPQIEKRAKEIREEKRKSKEQKDRELEAARNQRDKQQEVLDTLVDFDEDAKKIRALLCKGKLEDLTALIGTKNDIVVKGKNLDKLINNKMLHDMYYDARRSYALIDSFDETDIPAIKEFPMKGFAAAVPHELSGASPADIFNNLLKQAAGADISWIMNVKDDGEIAKNFGQNYAKLLLLYKCDYLYNTAEQLGIDIPKKVKDIIDAKHSLIGDKFELVNKRFALLCDHNYPFLPNLEETGITVEKAHGFGAICEEKADSQGFAETFRNYANLLDIKVQLGPNIDISEKLFKAGALDVLSEEADAFYVIKGDNEQPEKIGLDGILTALGKGDSVCSWSDKSRNVTVFSLSNDGTRIDSKDVKKYKLFSNVVKTQEDIDDETAEQLAAEKEGKFKERYNMHKAQGQKFLLDAAITLTTRLENGSFKVSEEQKPLLIQKYDKIISMETGTGFDKMLIKENEFEIHELAAKGNKLEEKRKKQKINGVKVDNYFWINPSLLVVHDTEWERTEIKDRIDKRNNEIFSAFSLKDETMDRIMDMSNAKDRQEYIKNLLDSGDIINHVNDPDKVKNALRGMFKTIMEECDVSQILKLDSDRELAENWARKRELFKLLLLDENFLLYCRDFGVFFTPEEHANFLALQTLTRPIYSALNTRFNYLAEPRFAEISNAGLSDDELNELWSANVIDVDQYMSMQEVQFGASKDLKKDKTLTLYSGFFDHLRKIGCLGNAPNLIPENIKFFGIARKEIAFTDALLRMGQGFKESGKMRQLLSNTVYILDDQKKTCFECKLGAKPGDYIHKQVDYAEFKEKIKEDEEREKELAKYGTVTEKNLQANINVTQLEYMLERLMSKDKWYKKLTPQMDKLRKSLTNLIDCYKALKPIPVSSDREKIEKAINELNEAADAYIKYKEKDAGLTKNYGEKDAFNEYRKNPSKVTLSERTHVRLSAAYNIKSLTKNFLKRNIEFDVAQHGIYKQQQRTNMNLKNKKDADSLSSKSTIAELNEIFDQTLAEISRAKNSENTGFMGELGSNGSNVSADSLEMFSMEKLYCNDAEELLMLAYDFKEDESGKLIYDAETTEKIYQKLAQVITYSALIYDPCKNDGQKLLNRLDIGPELEKQDIPKLANSDEMRKFLPAKDINPFNIVKLVAKGKELDSLFRKANTVEYEGDKIEVGIGDALAVIQNNRGAKVVYSGMVQHNINEFLDLDDSKKNVPNKQDDGPELSNNENVLAKNNKVL